MFFTQNYHPTWFFQRKGLNFQDFIEMFMKIRHWRIIKALSQYLLWAWSSPSWWINWSWVSPSYQCWWHPHGRDCLLQQKTGPVPWFLNVDKFGPNSWPHSPQHLRLLQPYGIIWEKILFFENNYFELLEPSANFLSFYTFPDFFTIKRNDCFCIRRTKIISPKIGQFRLLSPVLRTLRPPLPPLPVSPLPLMPSILFHLFFSHSPSSSSSSPSSSFPPSPASPPCLLFLSFPPGTDAQDVHFTLSFFQNHYF